MSHRLDSEQGDLDHLGAKFIHARINKDLEISQIHENCISGKKGDWIVILKADACSKWWFCQKLSRDFSNISANGKDINDSNCKGWISCFDLDLVDAGNHERKPPRNFPVIRQNLRSSSNASRRRNSESCSRRNSSSSRNSSVKSANFSNAARTERKSHARNNARKISNGESQKSRPKSNSVFSSKQSSFASQYSKTEKSEKNKQTPVIRRFWIPSVFKKKSPKPASSAVILDSAKDPIKELKDLRNDQLEPLVEEMERLKTSSTEVLVFDKSFSNQDSVRKLSEESVLGATMVLNELTEEKISDPEESPLWEAEGFEFKEIDFGSVAKQKKRSTRSRFTLKQFKSIYDEEINSLDPK